MPCLALAAVIVACMGYVPDRSKTVVVPRACAAKLSPVNQEAAKVCAEENGVKWKFARWRRR